MAMRSDFGRMSVVARVGGVGGSRATVSEMTTRAGPAWRLSNDAGGAVGAPRSRPLHVGGPRVFVLLRTGRSHRRQRRAGADPGAGYRG